MFYEKLFIAAISLVAQTVREKNLRAQAVPDLQEGIHPPTKEPGLVEAFVLGKVSSKLLHGDVMHP